jgi:hypothetical protein
MARAIMLVLPNTKFGAPPSSKVYPVSQRNRESQIREDGNWRPWNLFRWSQTDHLLTNFTKQIAVKNMYCGA